MIRAGYNHGLLIGPPSDAVRFLHGLDSGSFLSESSAAAMRDRHTIGSVMTGRPWTRTGYGLGLMMGEMEQVGLVYGHSGVGVDTVSALYCFPELSSRPIVATFAQGTHEGITEYAALDLARQKHKSDICG